ncbi:Putative epoxide hydrolase [Fulvia fulva]|uniref:Epoxide hydrolase n=1 Tax=Passalora fulva TaxID=5499 RepID=A0A9Q8LJH8_PASFU|nr:Putative epoxide hydrolase [Fulvia fulva]KAK4621263.1 putative epoxide hydrolase [Fulvia fulva]KAK4622374.1 putative epoxide hydrolase [Fulvia fulva]UJO18550.1 Putative epoxide hydrolase [Fulvia fulva]WPV16335.1 Putative epoxide hydrolase [Fulvia fulva]WPV31194.1 Putative epoxide hydrolase [Fulvia fulva]
MSASESISPFTLSIEQAVLDDLQLRLWLTRWPDKETVMDWSQGVPLAAIQELCEYWQTRYNWRRCEELLNSFPQFTTTIDGVEVYFLHFRSKHGDALPMVLTHGWPGSILEFRHVIDRLIDPEADGGTPRDAFHLVIPALPGYAFSSKPTETGWNYQLTARAWAVFMDRLGYTDSGWVAQGGDWGAHVTVSLGHQAPKGLKAVHMNSVYFEPQKEIQIPAKDKAGEGRAMDLDHLRDTTGYRGYSLQQSIRPQTLDYALADSPVAQAAWIYEKFRDWSHHNGDVGTIFSKDEMLDTIMLYWLSNSGTSSARYDWENKPDTTAWAIGADIAVGVSWFQGDTAYAPREWCERHWDKIVIRNEVGKGGRFAAWEQPEKFVREVREWRRNVGG